MPLVNIPSELWASLNKLAQLKIPEEEAGDDFVVDDYAGGNVDDAYSLGMAAGERYSARAIIACQVVSND